MGVLLFTLNVQISGIIFDQFFEFSFHIRNVSSKLTSEITRDFDEGGPHVLK